MHARRRALPHPRDDPHPPAGRRFFVMIRNAILEARHLHGAGHLLAVREDRLSEVARFEQSSDLRRCRRIARRFTWSLASFTVTSMAPPSAWSKK